MKNVLIGLLVVAAAAGVYFFVLKKKQKKDQPVLNKEWVIGKWKADAGRDSVFSSYRYELLKDGNIIRSVSDTIKADTLFYEWNKAGELVWKQRKADTAGKAFVIVKLTPDSLQVQSIDSTAVLFTRLK